MFVLPSKRVRGCGMELEAVGGWGGGRRKWRSWTCRLGCDAEVDWMGYVEEFWDVERV